MWGAAESGASAVPKREGLQGEGAFQNIPSWPVWVCGKDREAKVHMQRGQFCQSEKKQTACVRAPNGLAHGTTSPWPELAHPASRETFPQELEARAAPPPPPPACL